MQVRISYLEIAFASFVICRCLKSCSLVRRTQLKRAWSVALLSLGLALAAVAVGCGGGMTTLLRPNAYQTYQSRLLFCRMECCPFAYNQVVQVSGGVAPYSWTISSRKLPNGITLENSSTNAVNLAGMPDTAQTATFLIKFNDRHNNSGS